MSNDASKSQSSAPDGYISLVTRLWVGDNGRLIRGTIEEAHTGARLAIDLSALAAFLRASLGYAQGRAGNPQNEGEEDTIEERPGEISGEGSFNTDIQNGRGPDLQNGGEGGI